MSLVHILELSAMILVIAAIAGVTVAKYRVGRRRRGDLVHPYEYPPRNAGHGWMG